MKVALPPNSETCALKHGKPPSPFRTAASKERANFIRRGVLNRDFSSCGGHLLM